MKILHVSPSYYPAFKFGGPIVSVHMLNKGLVSKGIQVDVLTTDAGLGAADFVEGNWVALDGVKVKRCRAYGYENFTFSPGLLGEVFRLVRDYDLVHITATWNFPVLAAAIACIVKGKPYIISPRGALCRPASRMGGALFKRLYWSLLAKRYFSQAARIHFTTRQEMEFSRGFLNEDHRTLIVPNGLDFATFDRLPPPTAFADKFPVLRGRKFFLFMGRLSPIKGLDMLARAFVRYALENKDSQLVIAGPDNEGYAEQIKSLLRQGGALDRVLFAGMLNDSDKLAALSAAEALVLPSYSENFGMAAIEALAAGVPVIVSSGVAIADEVRANNAGLVFNSTAEGLYNALSQFTADAALRGQFADAGAKWVRRAYSIDSVSAIMIKAYREILE